MVLEDARNVVMHELVVTNSISLFLDLVALECYSNIIALV